MSTINIKELAELTSACITGNSDLLITGLSKIEESFENSLTFLYHPSFEKYFSTTKASAIIVKKGFNKSRQDITYLEVDAPEKAFLEILLKYFSPSFKLDGIDASAFIAGTAILSENVSIGKNVVVEDGVSIGNSSVIYHNTVIMQNVVIGNKCIIFPNVTIRENCVIGNNVIIHSGSVIGSDGFGYSRTNTNYVKIPQIGNVVIEDNVEIGSNTSVDRAALGSTIIKEGTKIDNLVQVAHNVVIGKHTAISAQTGISGSTKIGDNCVFGGQVGMVGHIEIADSVMIGAQSGVSKGIPSAGTYFGSPAQEIKPFLRQQVFTRNLESYVKRIEELEKKIKALEI